MANLRQEIAQGKKIVGSAEDIWGWGSPAGQIRLKRRADLLINKTKMAAGKKVLELGCGIGTFTKRFTQSPSRIYSIDVSSELLNQTRKRVPGSKLILADAEKLPFNDGTFDIVVGSSVLHHLDIKVALTEIFRVLKKTGVIAFAEPNMLNPQIALERSCPFMRKLFHATPKETAFFRWQTVGLFKNAGFTDIEVSPYGFLHPKTPECFTQAVSKLETAIESLPIIREIAGSLVIFARKP